MRILNWVIVSHTATQAVAVTSPGVPGVVDVTVTTPGGTSPLNPPADQFSYVAAPSVTASDPGGTYNGSAFPATATVTGIDGIAGSSLEGVSPTLLYYVGSDTSGTGSTSAPVSAGTYTVVASFAGSAGYTAAKSQPVKFNVTPATLTITADNKFKSDGAPLPKLTFTCTGLVGSDSLTAQPTLLPTATAASPLGMYPITVSGVAASANYTITLVNGTLTVIGDDTIGGYDSTTSRFFLRDSNTTGFGTTDLLYGVPSTSLIPLCGDWDGNGTETIGLYDPTHSVFYLRNSNSIGVADTVFAYGPAGGGFTPIVGDWDGNGTDTVGLYDPTNSVFYLKNSNTTGMADTVVVYGAAHTSGLTPIVGDWDGNGTDTVGLYNSTTSVFYLRCSNTTGCADIPTFTFGVGSSGEKPLVGDWTGTGKDTMGLYDPATSILYLRCSNTTGYADVPLFVYGPAQTAAWKPLVGHWTGAGQGLMATDQVAASSDTPVLTQSDLQPIVQEAVARWTKAGLNAATVQKLAQAQFVIGDLPGSYLGETEGNQVYIDANAAGNGWFIDPTPALNEEFASSGNQQQLMAVDPRAVDRMDLLTVVEHELGHVAGLSDLDSSLSDLMSSTLGKGIRRNASASDVDAVFAGYDGIR
jgi:hypothetical protein